ncbi:MAG: hypothetical protein N2260_07805 [Syntrophobacterales bacterium]|nr:hypothetical protein [Syntrophobacterales bacterium]
MASKTLLEKIFLFPYSHLPDSYYRFIQLVLPSLHILGFIRSPYCPPWDRGTIATCLLYLDEEKTKLLQNIYKGYQNFAKIHGERHLLETISFARTEEEWSESRLYLRSMLKNPEMIPSDPVWNMVVESIVFLELARELDERDIEMDNDLFKVQELEGLFRSSLGLEAEEDLNEVEESVRLTLEELPRRSYFGYLTKMRAVHWLRIYFSGFPFRVSRCNIKKEQVITLGEDLPIFLCVSKDSAEELIDPVRTREERSGFNWSPDVLTLLEVPNVFETMKDDRFYDLNTSLSPNTVNFWTSLQGYVENSQNRSPLLEEASKLNESLNQLIARDRVRVPSRFRLSAIFHPSLDILKVWRLIDSSGYPLMEKSKLLKEGSLPILVFEELPIN